MTDSTASLAKHDRSQTSFVLLSWCLFNKEPNADLIRDVQALKAEKITRILRHLGIITQRSASKAELELQLYKELTTKSKSLESVTAHLASRDNVDSKLGLAKAKATVRADCVKPSGQAQQMGTCNTVKVSAVKAEAGVQHKCELCGGRIYDCEYVQALCNSSHNTVSHKACWRQHFGGFSKKQAPRSCACNGYLVNILVHKADPETAKPRVAHTIFNSAAGGRIEELSTCILRSKKTLDTNKDIPVDRRQHASTRITSDQCQRKALMTCKVCFFPQTSASHEAKKT